MSHATLEVADIVRCGRRQFRGRSTDRGSCLASSQGARCDRAMPHCGSGGTSRSVRPLRTSGHLLLTRVATGTARSARGTRACQVMASGALPRAVAGSLFSRRLHSAARTLLLPYSATRECSTHLLLLSQRGSHAQDGTRSQAPRSRYRFPWRPAQSGDRPSRHHPHVHYIVPAGCLRCRSIQMDSRFQQVLLPACRSSQARLSVGKFTEALRYLYRCSKLQFHGSLRRDRKPRCIQQGSLISCSFMTGSSPVPSRALRWTRPGPELPGSLYPSRRHLQLPTPRASRWPGLIPLAGLQRWRPREDHDHFSA